MNEDEKPPPSPSSHPLRALLKIGGEVVADRAALRALLRQVRALERAGWRFAIVHGAGPQAGELQTRLGLPTRKVHGRRVTDGPTLQVVKQVLGGEVNLDVVAAAAGEGLRAVGISACSAGLVRPRRRAPERVPDSDDPIDLGFVADVDGCDPSLVQHLWAGGFTPIVNPLSLATQERDDAGVPQVFNVNADTVASELAYALRVDHLFLVTSVPGVLRDKDDPSTRIPRLHRRDVERAIAEGIIVGGMIPKVEGVLPYLGRGLGAVHILGVQADGLLQAARDPGRYGSVLLPDAAEVSHV